MSTIKVNKIENTSTTAGGVEIDSSGHVQVDGLQMPTAGALSNRNLIINGAMNVAQRGTSATVSDGSNEGYSTVDRWFLNFNAGPGGTLVFSQSTDAPDGFSYSAKLDCSLADSTHTGTEQIYLVQYIEAQNLQQLAYGSSSAKPITISWYMKAVNFSSPITLALETVDGTAEYYVVSKTPTSSWARYSVTIPGSSSATIDNNNEQGLRVKFVVAGSSTGTFAAASDSTTWSTTRADYRSDIGNLVSSTSNELYITGVQLEVGEKATPFEHRSYGDELARCQRYCLKIDATNYSYTHMANSYSASTAIGVIHFPVEMRAAPTTLTTTGTASDYRAVHGSSITTCNAVPAINGATKTSGGVNFFTNNAFTIGRAAVCGGNTAGTAYLIYEGGSEL